MSTAQLSTLLSAEAYPGRGIVMGCSSSGTHAATAYFIMGRSEHSRNRRFTQTTDGIRTEAVDVAKLTDPSLIIYHPVRQCGNHTIVTNGDQTDTIAHALESGGTFADAIATRSFEPDAPHFTPRISGMLTIPQEGSCYYRLAILKSADGDPTSVQRFFYDYPTPITGQGHFIHTYRPADGERLPSFAGEPILISLEDASPNALADRIWQSLHPDHKVALYVAFTDLATGSLDTHIINRYA